MATKDGKSQDGKSQDGKPPKAIDRRKILKRIDPLQSGRHYARPHPPNGTPPPPDPTRRYCPMCERTMCSSGFRRGLCYRCSKQPDSAEKEKLMTPPARAVQPSRRRIPKDWTSAEPGSPAKVAVMMERDVAGEVVNHPWDRKWDKRKKVVTEGPEGKEVRGRPRTTEVEAVICEDGELRTWEEALGRVKKNDGKITTLSTLPTQPTWKEIHGARVRHAGDGDENTEI